MTYLQIESRHKEFFGLVCYHEYYRDLVCKDLVFEPTPETVQMLRNYSLIFKPLPFGFLVTYSPDESPQRLKHAPAKLRFSFVIQSQNNEFVNFTDLPFQSNWEAFHFSNLSSEFAEVDREVPREVYYYFKQLNVADSQKKLLHLPELSEVELKPRKFTLDFSREGMTTKAVGYDKIALVDEWKEDTLGNGKPLKRGLLDVRKIDLDHHVDYEVKKLLKQGVSREEVSERIDDIRQSTGKMLTKKPSFSHLLDFRHAPYGKYAVKLGKKEKAVYIAENAEIRRFGMLDIHLDASQTHALLNRDAADDGEVVKPQLYHLYFKARSTYWRYYFMNHKGSRVAPVKVKEENGLVEFEDPYQGRLDSLGNPAKIVISSQPISLRERPEYMLWLERTIGKKQMKDLRLPVPGVDLIKPIARGGETRIYSDAYVYL